MRFQRSDDRRKGQRPCGVIGGSPSVCGFSKKRRRFSLILAPGAFAQFTYRESLREIEACLGAAPDKLYHLGFRARTVAHSTLADANETRDWHIYFDLAQVLIHEARKLYAGDSFGIDLKQTAYALDSTTIDLCLSLFHWAHFRSNKAAIKLHTFLDPRGEHSDLHPDDRWEGPRRKTSSMS